MGLLKTPAIIGFDEKFRTLRTQPDVPQYKSAEGFSVQDEGVL